MALCTPFILCPSAARGQPAVFSPPLNPSHTLGSLQAPAAAVSHTGSPRRRGEVGTSEGVVASTTAGSPDICGRQATPRFPRAPTGLQRRLHRKKGVKEEGCRRAWTNSHVRSQPSKCSAMLGSSLIALGDSLVASRQRRCSHLWLGGRCKGGTRHTVVVAVMYWAADAETSLTRKLRACWRPSWTTARTVTNSFGLMRQALLLGRKRHIANELAIADFDLASRPLQMAWHGLGHNHTR